MLVNWSNIFAFIVEREPGFPAIIEGVSQEEIDTCQRELGIIFPAAYIQFITTMGADTGRYHPFGPKMDTNFYRLLRQVPNEDYDVREYFPVALETNESRAPMCDFYLDLRRSDGEDAPLVLAENGSDWCRMSDEEITLLERLTESTWPTFELPRYEANRVIYVHAEEVEGLETARKQALALLDRRGHSPTLPPQLRIDCMASETEASIVRIKEHLGLVRVVVAGHDEKELGRIVELFLDNVPNAAVSERMRSLPVP